MQPASQMGGTASFDLLAAAANSLQGFVASLSIAQPDAAARVERARCIHTIRRLRDSVFPTGLFAEPAWDMLLDLYISEHSRRRLVVSDLGRLAGVPGTTALRHLGDLVDAGVVARQNSPSDGRRIYVTLTQDATEKLDRLMTIPIA